jgi:hypothetical protein
MGDQAEIETALDERHTAARIAFARRDINAYTDVFCAGLEYRQADGIVIGRSRLMRDVATQFKRLSKVDFSFRREEIEVSDGAATETVTQIVSAEASAFGFVRRLWRVSRRGRYTWLMRDGVWKIAGVHILSEEVLSGGWRFGR